MWGEKLGAHRIGRVGTWDAMMKKEISRQRQRATRTCRIDAQTSVGKRNQQLVAMRGRKRERHARDAGACNERKAIAAEVEEVDAALLIDGRKLVAARIEGHCLKAE